MDLQQIDLPGADVNKIRWQTITTAFGWGCFSSWNHDQENDSYSPGWRRSWRLFHFLYNIAWAGQRTDHMFKWLQNIIAIPGKKYSPWSHFPRFEYAYIKWTGLFEGYQTTCWLEKYSCGDLFYCISNRDYWRVQTIGSWSVHCKTHQNEWSQKCNCVRDKGIASPRTALTRIGMFLVNDSN